MRTEPKPLFVCLDTNVYERHHFDSRLIDRIRHLRESAAFTLLLPEVIEVELSDRHKAVSLPTIKAPDKRGCPRMADTVSAARKVLRDGERKIFEEFTGALAPHVSRVAMTDAVAAGAVRRTMEKRKPSVGGEEVRDCVIWETLLAQARDDECTLILVSDDRKAFPDDDPDLADEAREFGIDVLRTLPALERAILGFEENDYFARVMSSGTDQATWTNQLEATEPELATDSRVVEALAGWALANDPNYDADLEIDSASRDEIRVTISRDEDGVSIAHLHETWGVRVLYTCDAGIDYLGERFSHSGTEAADGSLELRRTVRWQPSTGSAEESLTVGEITLDIIGLFDPNEPQFHEGRDWRLDHV